MVAILIMNTYLDGNKMTKEEFQKIMKIKGSARGTNMKIIFDYIKKEKGAAGVKKVENKMAELGFPVKHKKLKIMDFYPLNVNTLFVVVVKEAFNFNDEEITRIGYESFNFNIFMKLFMKYFSSLEMVSKQVSRVFRRHYTVGEFSMPSFSEKEKFIILREKFNVHPIYCPIHKGFYIKTAELTVKSKVKAKEVKCMFRGDPYCEFLLTW